MRIPTPDFDQERGIILILSARIGVSKLYLFGVFASDGPAI